MTTTNAQKPVISGKAPGIGTGPDAAQAETSPAFDDIPAVPFIAAVQIGSVHTLLPDPLARALRNRLHHVLPHDYASGLFSTLNAVANPSQLSEKFRQNATIITPNALH